MVRREIEIDEDTNLLLTELASEYEGDLNLALGGFGSRPRRVGGVREATHENALRDLRDRSEADLREGRTVTWEDVKTRNRL
jgi:hypothetical protein